MGLRRTNLVIQIASYAFLAFWTLVVLFPAYWVLTTSFKLTLDARSNTRYFPWIDFQPTLEPWRYIFVEQAATIVRPFSNSVIVSVASSLIAVLLGSMAGYALARYQYRFGFWRNNDIAFWFISQRMMPPVAVVLPFLVMYKALNLLDTQIGLVIAYVGFNLPFAVWVTRDFFAALPRDLEDSALIDGCSRWQAFLRIALPLATPGLIAAFILCLIFSWNEYLFAVMLSFQNSGTLPAFVAGQNSINGPNLDTMSVITVVAVLPVVVIGLGLERYITKGLIGGAVK